MDQAIKIGMHGARAVTVGSADATVAVAGSTVGVSFGKSSSSEYAVKDALSYEMLQISGAATSGTDAVAIRAASFVIFDGTTTATDMPATGDASVVLKITDAD